MGPFFIWLIQGAVGPAVVGLPVTWAATDLAGAAKRWFRRLQRSDGLSRIVRAAAGDDLGVSDAEFAAIRHLLEQQSTWVVVGRGTVEDLAKRIASCLHARPGEGSLAAARAIAAGLLEFAVRDLEPELFQQVLFARLDRMQADQASALDMAMLGVHADLAAQLARQDASDAERFARVMGQLGRVLDRLPPGPADQGEVAVYLAGLITWLSTDPWPQDTRFEGPALTPTAIERKRWVVDPRGPESQYLDADELATQCARLVVLGGPGAGKTWLARRAARLCAEVALDALAAGALPEEVELPLYTTCARLAAAPPGDGIRRAIVASAFGHLPDLGGARVQAALQMLFEERNAPTLLVADSLEEARGAEERIRQADTLPATWRIMLTSRPASWNRQLAIGEADPSRRVGVLQPLRYPDDIEPFIVGWFSGRPAQSAGLVAQLRNRPALRQAATVPLILAFYCIIGGDQQLPDRRADLHAKVIRCMLTGRWRAGADRDLDPDACLETLRDWAWFAAASDPVSRVGAWFDEFPTPRVRRSQDDREALDHVATPTGPPDLDTWMTPRRFVHRSVQEHLVAEHVAFRMTADEAARELLNHLWYDPDWERAAPAALALHPQREQVLMELVCRVTGGEQLRADVAAVDGCREFRWFLARVAQESNEDDWSPEAAELIGQARLDLVTSQRDNLRQIIANGWPTSDDLVSHSLLRLLGRARTALEALKVTEEVAVLDPAADQLASAQNTLVELFARERNPTIAGRLASTVVQLAVTAGDRARTRQSLLTLLADEAIPTKAAELARAVSRLEPSPRDQARAKETLFTLLAGDPYPEVARDLAEPIVRLSVTPQDRAQAKEALLAMLTDEANPRIAAELATAVSRLDPSPRDRTRARNALLTLLADETSPWSATPMADAVGRLDPSPQDRAQGRGVLLGLLASEDRPQAAKDLADAVSRLDPSPRDQARARGVLLDLLASQTDPDAARDLANTVAQLAVTRQDQAQARGRLLARLAGTADPVMARELADVLARLDPPAEQRAQALKVILGLYGEAEIGARLTEVALGLPVTPQDRAAAREALLALLASETRPWMAKDLAEAVARLDPSPQDLAQTRESLLELLASEDRSGMAESLADAVARLGPSPQDLAQTRESLLKLLASEDASVMAEGLAEAVARLNPSPKDCARVRKTLLKLLARDAHSRKSARLAAQFAVTAEDRARTRESLLALVVDRANPYMAAELAAAVAELDPSPQDQARTREALLTLLASEDSRWAARQLTDAIARLDPSPQDQARTREALLTLLASETNPGNAALLAALTAGLSPVIADLRKSDSWPCPPPPELLAAARRNSELHAWLSALPLLTRVLAWNRT